MAQAAAPLSKPHLKKAVKHTATPPMSQTARGKRPRPSDPIDLDKPPAAIRKKEGMNGGVKAATSNSALGSAYTKGMHLAFIDDAFTKRAKGDNTRYDEIVVQFKSLLPVPAVTPTLASSSAASPSFEPPKAAARRVWLDALTHVVSKLDKSHAPLVETIIDVPWATMEDAFVTAYVRFIGALVSARTEWLQPVLAKCVKGFKYRSNYTASSPASMPTLTRRMLYGRLHVLLRMLISLIPTFAPSLGPLLASHFPSKREPRVAQICYIDNLLAVTEYCPALVEDIFTLVVERALNIDVEIQGDPDEWEDLEDEVLAAEGEAQSVRDVVDRPTALDEDDDSSDDDDDGDGGLNLDDIDSDDEPDPVGDDEAARQSKGKEGMSQAAVRKVLENRSKLDAILKVVLDHLAVAHGDVITPTLSPSNGAVKAPAEETTPTPEDPVSQEILERRLTLFCTMLDIFDRTLLRTFKTRNTQFLLFYLCSLNISSSDHFIGVLLGRLLDVDAPAVTRVAAAGYVASFISRASYVDTVMTRKVVRHLCQFLENQMDDYANGEGGSQHLPVFYAVAQAVFYIFCFRWKDLLEEDNEEDDIVLEDGGRRWMMGLESIKKVVSSSFNPLKVCAQPVVQQFATIAQKTNFLSCWSIIQANRRVKSRETAPPAPSQMPRYASSTPAKGVAAQPTPRQLLVAEEMDSFFPFDPFKLPQSAIYIDGIYRSWVGEDESASEASTDSDADDDSSSDGDTETDNDEDYIVRTGLAVPGSHPEDADDEEFARSFEAALSLSVSPPSFLSSSSRSARAKGLPMSPFRI